VARAEAYLHANFHLDPSNRLATMHERHRQTDRTGQDRTDRQRTDSIGRTDLQTVAQKLQAQQLVFSELTFKFTICCRPSVCNARAPYSGGSNFRHYFCGIRYL